MTVQQCSIRKKILSEQPVEHVTGIVAALAVSNGVHDTLPGIVHLEASLGAMLNCLASGARHDLTSAYATWYDNPFVSMSAWTVKSKMVLARSCSAVLVQQV